MIDFLFALFEFVQKNPLGSVAVFVFVFVIMYFIFELRISNLKNELKSQIGLISVKLDDLTEHFNQIARFEIRPPGDHRREPR